MTSEIDLKGNWNYPTLINFGTGSVESVYESCRKLKITKPLLVTDSGLVKLNIVTDLIKTVKSKGLYIQVYSNVKPNPTGDNVIQGVKEYHVHNCDGVIAMGGGSALDAGKTIALMARQKYSLWDFEDVGDNWQRVNPEGIAPCIAIPTTAGTGSEVGRASVIVDEDSLTKKIIFHPDMLPNVVISDAQLTLALPANITAATGMDAFVHNLEAYCVNGYHPMADGIALEGMRLVKEWLPEAVANGDNLVARSHMLVASTMGATAFQKGLGAVHALAHPLGAIYDKHHGLLNAILLPYVLVKNKSVISIKVSHIARCLNLDSTDFDSFFSWLLEFRKSLGIPDDLQSIGINADKSELIGQLASIDPTASGNPINFTADQYCEIFINAVNGKL
ncbi:MAG: alcohol dehydrogenase [endosymbiont of Galathealinum brachiosum]|uniref:Alcohol dehydrogenase n=1 Tax=endosymbiont of Galathealinum brachiosum TaxID=2200906 RepID=A0A370DJE0_9GAMM|nr:MAG: alcohol dehydrogenase [endosymbiont of Galathealinum brachiosum]